MKRLFLMLVLLASLTGCGGPSTPVIEEESNTDAAPAERKEPDQGKPVSYWIARLRDPDRNTSSEASGVLAQMGEPAVPALVEVLKDPDEQVRRRGQVTLGRIGAPAARGLIVVLTDARTGVIAMAILVDLNTAALPALIEALEDKDAGIRTGAAKVLGRLSIKSAKASAALRKGLEDKDPAVRAAAVDALAKIGPGSNAIEPLIAALKDDHAPVRAGAARALGKIPGKRGPSSALLDAVPALMALLQDDDPDVRAGAAEALGDIHPKGVKGIVTALLKCLADPKAPVREQAAYALGAIQSHPQLMIPELAKALQKDQDPKVRMNAARALGTFSAQSTEIIPPLRAGLKDADYRVRQAALGALQNLDEPGLKVIARAANSRFEDVRTAGIKAAITLGGADAEAIVPFIAEGLKSKDVTVRENAAKTLVDLGPDARSAIPALVEALQDENPSVGLRAAEALGKIGKPAIPALTKALQSKSDGIRRLAAEGLSAAGPSAKGAVSILAELLRDKTCSTETKQSVVAALAKIGPAALPAASALIAAIQEPKQDDAIRRNASSALVNIGEPAVAEITRAFRDPNASFYIRDSLRRIGKAAVPAVADALTDKTRSVRERAAALLGDIGAGARSALPALTEAAKDPDPGVSKAARLAMKKIQSASVGKE